MNGKKGISRRATLKGAGALGALAAAGAGSAFGEEKKTIRALAGTVPVNTRKSIMDLVARTPLVDTHEHLLEEKSRMPGAYARKKPCDDCTFLLNHYLDSDLQSAGMPEKDYKSFFAPGMDPVDKWKLVEPWWPYVKNTGYGRAVVLALRDLYGVAELSTKTVGIVQKSYDVSRRPGLYHHVLKERANIESCQVHSLEDMPFMESAMPAFLMQDICIMGMFEGPEIKLFGKPTGIRVSALSDWHAVIDWWFNKYGRYATAAKSQNAYKRSMDYEDVPPEKAEPIFRKKLEGGTLNPAEKKALEDHLFWYAVRKATEYHLPVKMHTGYYAQWAGKPDRMPLSRIMMNPASITDLCAMAPDTRFVFMHICYPYYEEMIAVAKQNSNAYMDMCWAWILNPIAAKDFLKKFLVTAPSNKILTFGGDYIPVEPVLGHAAIARNGIALALAELVEENWIGPREAQNLIEPIMRGNARSIFNLDEKEKLLSTVK